MGAGFPLGAVLLYGLPCNLLVALTIRLTLNARISNDYAPETTLSIFLVTLDLLLVKSFGSTKLVALLVVTSFQQ